MYTNLFIALALLAANAFFVSAEFALVKARGFRIEALAEGNRFGARQTQYILRNLEAYLACCQLGITMTSLGLGWVGEPTVSALLTPLLVPMGLPEETVHLIAFAVGFIVFSSLHIVVGEQVPKTFAIRQPEIVSLWIAWPLHAAYLVFFPLNWLLNGASRAILRALGVKEASHMEILTDVEIEGLVEISAEHGKIEGSRAEQVTSLLRLADLTVADVMVHRRSMKTIEAGLPSREILAQAMASPHTRLPVWKDTPDNIIGVLHARDVLRAVTEKGRDGVALEELMRPPWFVPDTVWAEDQLAEFLRRREHFAIVVDEFGELKGLVTLEDIIEEIVGDIKDEHDVAFTGVRPQPDGSVNVDGSVPIRDLNRAMDWDLPDEVAVTVAGLVIHESQTIPDPGQVFSFHGYRFHILRRQRNAIAALRVVREAKSDVAA